MRRLCTGLLLGAVLCVGPVKAAEPLELLVLGSGGPGAGGRAGAGYVLLLDGPRLDYARQLRHMIHVQMGQQHDIQLTQVQVRLAQADEGARSGIQQNPRRAVEQQHIASPGTTTGAGAA